MSEKKAAPTTAKKRDLTAAKIAFATWLRTALPEHRTQTALAQHLGVDNATLSDWKHDPLVLSELDKLDQRRQATWAQATARLERIVLYGKDPDAIAAVRELGKLWGKYPSEKHEIAGRMSLADFLATGGFTKEEATSARVN